MAPSAITFSNMNERRPFTCVLYKDQMECTVPFSVKKVISFSSFQIAGKSLRFVKTAVYASKSLIHQTHPVKIHLTGKKYTLNHLPITFFISSDTLPNHLSSYIIYTTCVILALRGTDSRCNPPQDQECRTFSYRTC